MRLHHSKLKNTNKEWGVFLKTNPILKIWQLTICFRYHSWVIDNYVSEWPDLEDHNF